MPVLLRMLLGVCGRMFSDSSDATALMTDVSRDGVLVAGTAGMAALAGTLPNMVKQKGLCPQRARLFCGSVLADH